MEHDAWFFVGVFVFIFLVWAATGGPLHPLSFTGPTLAQPQELGGGTYLSLPRAPFRVGGSDVALPGSSGSGSSLSPSTGGSGVSLGNTSPYRSLASLSHSVNGAGSADSRREYIEFSVAQNANAPVDISGWTLRSDTSGSASSIPQGTEVPTSGIINAIQNVVLSPGDRALIVSGQSPIGASFRENKCIGYFSTFQQFYPSLPQTCPVPSDELETRYGPDYIRDVKCIDYVHSLSRCQVVLTPPPNLSSACQSFLINNLNYNGCVTAHQNDLDFKGATWRVYLGRTSALWRQTHEYIRLFDREGKTVDAFSY